MYWCGSSVVGETSGEWERKVNLCATRKLLDSSEGSAGVRIQYHHQTVEEIAHLVSIRPPHTPQAGEDARGHFPNTLHIQWLPAWQKDYSRRWPLLCSAGMQLCLLLAQVSVTEILEGYGVNGAWPLSLQRGLYLQLVFTLWYMYVNHFKVVYIHCMLMHTMYVHVHVHVHVDSTRYAEIGVLCTCTLHHVFLELYTTSRSLWCACTCSPSCIQCGPWITACCGVNSPVVCGSYGKPITMLTRSIYLRVCPCLMFWSCGAMHQAQLLQFLYIVHHTMLCIPLISCSWRCIHVCRHSVMNILYICVHTVM